MRARFAPVVGLGLLGLAAAWPPVAAMAQPAPVAAPTDEVVQLGRQLDAARVEIQRLRAQLADAEPQKASLAECRARNDRLVAIGRDLVASYEKRYAMSSFGPFPGSRVRFETEMQKTGESIYQNQVDAASPRVAPDSASDSGKKDKKKDKK